MEDSPLLKGRNSLEVEQYQSDSSEYLQLGGTLDSFADFIIAGFSLPEGRWVFRIENNLNLLWNSSILYSSEWTPAPILHLMSDQKTSGMHTIPRETLRKEISCYCLVDKDAQHMYRNSKKPQLWFIAKHRQLCLKILWGQNICSVVSDWKSAQGRLWLTASHSSSSSHSSLCQD